MNSGRIRGRRILGEQIEDAGSPAVDGMDSTKPAETANGYVRSLSEMWNSVLADKKEAGKDGANLGGKAAATLNSRFNDALGLGMSVRAYLLYRWLQSRLGPEGTREKLRNRVNGRLGKTYTDAQFRDATNWRACFKPERKDIACALLAEAAPFRSMNTDQPIREDEFFSKPFFGLAAPTDFLSWLETGYAPPADRIHHFEDPGYIDADERKELLDRLAEFMKTDGPQIAKLVHCADDLRALTALAGYMIRTYAGEPSADSKAKANDAAPVPHRLPVCYLPLHRSPSNSGVITLPWLVAELDAFYAQAGEDAGRPPVTPREYVEAIARIRSRMMTHPAFIIFDGHRAGESAKSEACSLIADNGLDGLIRDLVTPRVTGRAAVENVHTFQRNRILILSQHEDKRLMPYVRSSERLASLPPEKLSEAIATGDWKNTNELIELSRDQTQYLRFESVLRLADAHLCGSGKHFEARLRELERARLSAPQDSMVPDFVNRLDREAPFDLFLLRWLALSETGLRPQTLHRLLAICKSDPPDGLGFELTDRMVSVGEIQKRLDQYPAIIASGPDEHIEDIDVSPITGIPPFDASPAGSPGHPDDDAPRQAVAYCIATERLRELFRSNFLKEPGSGPLRARMHLLLSEEAMRQMTTIMRRSTPGSPFNVRKYRRLIECLIYGIRGVVGSRSDDDPVRPRLDGTLPDAPVEGLRRLYALFFRSVLQAPPDYELARRLGLPGVVCDLWLELWSTDASPAQDKSLPPPPLLSVRAPSDVLIALDLFKALARNSFQADRLDQTARVLESWKDYLEARSAETHGDDVCRALAASRMEARKVELDLELLRADPHHDELKSLNGAVADNPVIRQFSITDQRQNYIDVLVKPGPGTWTTERAFRLHRDGCKGIDDALRQAVCDVAPRELRHAADLIALKAEADAINAETLSGDTARFRGFLNAFTTHFISGRVRAHAFTVDPLGRAFRVNAHAARNQIRVCLKLHQIAKLEKAGLPGDAREPLAHFFAYQAQRMLDILTRQTFRYPSERPSLLALEAMIARIYYKRPDQAMALLVRADDLQVSMGRPRVRLRLGLERAKCLRELAASSSLTVDDDTRYHLLETAGWEILRVSKLVESSNRLWALIISQQRTLISNALNEVRPGSDLSVKLSKI